MKTTLIVISLIVIAVLIWFVVLGIMSRSGNPSGLIDGKLSRCQSKPNCVCSEYLLDKERFISPFSPQQPISMQTNLALKQVIEEMGGQIQQEQSDYLAFTFKSALFGFVDDMEVRLDPAQNVIHIRSASRVGHSDRGVNAKRVLLFKKQLLEKVSQRDTL